MIVYFLIQKKKKKKKKEEERVNDSEILERFSDPGTSVRQCSEGYDVVRAAAIGDLTQGLRGGGTRSSHPHFVLRELSGLKQTGPPRIRRPVPISAQQHLPINPRWQAAARGTTPPLCVPPGAEPPEGFNEDRQEVGEDGLSRKWPHIDSGIQRTEKRFIRGVGMRMERNYMLFSIWSWEGKKCIFMKNK